MKAKRTWMIGLCLAAFGLTACGVKQEEHDKVVAAKKALEAELAQAKQLSAEQMRRMASLEADLKKVRDTLGGQLESQKAELKKQLDEIARTREALAELERLKERMRKQRELNDQLQNALKDMISAGQLKLVNINGRLVIQMEAKILFPSGKANLTRAGKAALVQLAQTISKIDRHFQVAGHTDNVVVKNSPFGDNWGLSAQRAIIVVRLLQKSGVPSARLSAAGYSEFQAVASNRTEQGKGQNRRIEITLFATIPNQIQGD
jgi:chemotaxis protein MotB